VESFSTPVVSKQKQVFSRQFFVRIPARINLMGVHIEHRGGHVNYMTIAREILMAVTPCADDTLHFTNVDAEYDPFSFSISEEIQPGHKIDWLEYINSVKIQKGAWENYIKCAAYYLQNQFEKPLKGMQVTVFGKIPPAAGLSSSSALVVGTTEALNFINQLGLSPEQKTLMCGEAEWYVGTRGGAGDHAAIIYGKRCCIAHLQFFPLRAEMIPLPEDVTVVACHSLVKAKQAGGARDIFNGRVASYEIAFSLLRKNFPQFQVQHFRDFGPQHLGIPLPDLYRMLKSLPEKITRAEVFAALPDEYERFQKIFATHSDPPEGYSVRAVCLFGLSECARSEQTGNLLKSGDLEKIGQIMYISHEGDRIMTHNSSGQPTPLVKNFSDAYFDDLIHRLDAADPAVQESAGLALQPGGYDCSTPEMDLIVDICRQVDGVLGAGLTGGGLGGMVLALVQQSSVPALLQALNQKYYQPRNLPFSAEVCAPVDGISVLAEI